jgi:hypothetical protein
MYSKLRHMLLWLGGGVVYFKLLEVSSNYSPCSHALFWTHKLPRSLQEALVIICKVNSKFSTFHQPSVENSIKNKRRKSIGHANFIYFFERNGSGFFLKFFKIYFIRKYIKIIFLIF